MTQLPERIEIFDCNCSFGEAARPAFRYARDAAELQEEMCWCGVERALVYHSGMRFGSPVVWNGRLLSEVESFANLVPTWAILPSQTGEQADLEKFIAAMRRCGIKALRAFPQEHRYRLDGRTFGGLLEAITERHIPLLAKENLSALGDLLAEFPDLTLVAMNQGPHSLERYLRPLVEIYPNFYVDTSYYIVDGLIEEFCERYGPRRLVFGSGFPDNCSGAALLRLICADIDLEAKRAIAAGNLDRLLGEVNL